MPTCTIDGISINLNQEEDRTILQLAREHGVAIPTFCNQPFLEPGAACRVCVVEVDGRRNLQAACATPVADGMVIKTTSERVDNARKTIIELLLANHQVHCPTCQAHGKCLLQQYARRYGVETNPYSGALRDTHDSDDFESIVRRDQSKCILCGKCVAVCAHSSGVEAITRKGRAVTMQVGSSFDRKLYETRCINCGQCVAGCPTGAIYVRSDTELVHRELLDPDRKVIFQTAPSIRAALGEEFGYPAGTVVTGKLAASLRRLGAYRVFQTDFGADLTIMEEGHEFIRRLEENEHLPMFTSCCPAWQKYIEHFAPELLPNLSSCKSPQAMAGSMIKHWYAKRENLKTEELTVVSIMPCSAKKWEITRPGCAVNEIADVDYVLTARELADLIRMHNIDFRALPDEDYDPLLGVGSGAGEIFGATGGVMEAALRTVVEKLSGKPLPRLDFTELRGLSSVREATVRVKGKDIAILVVSGLANLRPFLDDIRAGKSKYHFIEIMTCPGGCINGGGMPFYQDYATVEQRYKALFADDAAQTIRTSHKNPAIITLYEEFLKEPAGEKAHKFLHTPYMDRSSVL